MAWTQSDIDALKAAMATGAAEVQYSDGSRIRYNSLKDMRMQLGLMQQEVNAAASVQTTRVVRIGAGKGF